MDLDFWYLCFGAWIWCMLRAFAPPQLVPTMRRSGEWVGIMGVGCIGNHVLGERAWSAICFLLFWAGVLWAAGKFVAVSAGWTTPTVPGGDDPVRGFAVIQEGNGPRGETPEPLAQVAPDPEAAVEAAASPRHE